MLNPGNAAMNSSNHLDKPRRRCSVGRPGPVHVIFKLADEIRQEGIQGGGWGRDGSSRCWGDQSSDFTISALNLVTDGAMLFTAHGVDCSRRAQFTRWS
jgi:hypothetical protein